MLAPQSALVGGYRIDGVDVHAAQAGTVSRAVGAVAAGLVKWAVAIDDNTAAVLSRPGDEDYEVIGTGNCWDIRLTGAGPRFLRGLQGPAVEMPRTGSGSG